MKSLRLVVGLSSTIIVSFSSAATEPSTIPTQIAEDALPNRNVVVSNGQSLVLPPEPGPANESTLLGIDSDGDGIRDDIQRYIGFKYFGTPVYQTAVAYARKMQQIMYTYTTSKSYSAVLNDGICPPYPEDLEFEVLFQNTYERAMALLEANSSKDGALDTNVNPCKK